MKKIYEKNFFKNIHESEFFGQLRMCSKHAVTKYAIHAIHTQARIAKSFGGMKGVQHYRSNAE